ncbi:MAG: sugar transferase [Planctomycetota bacterium]|nr:sugar transferase [Planctomycetota bacterium]
MTQSLAPAPTPLAPPRPPATTVWGLDVHALHERFWASRCVQVVRCAGGHVDRGPQLYLLTDPHTLAIFDPAGLLDQLRWLKPRCVRVRLVDHHEQDYEERVLAEPNGDFLAIQRIYRARTRATRGVWLTEDRRVAERWAAAPSRDAATRELKATHPRGTVFPWRQPGIVCDADTEQDRFRTAVLGRWKDPRSVVDTVYCYEPGVWLHETVRPPPSVRFIPPVWAGAGVRFSPGQLVVGPAVLADAASAPVTPSDVDWHDVQARPSLVNPGAVTRLAQQRKRIFDVAFSATALALTLPLYPPILLAILLEDGRPFFFAHRRQTIGGREFPCLKFRTMVRNAERIKADLVAANLSDGAHFYIKNDPRVTRVGRILRKFHLDELPQFWNVLAGHMSVVGPRPSPDKENQFCPAWREARLSVRPGVTGLWQVRRTRAPATDFQEWVRYDLEYVQRQSFMLDLRIIADTVRQILHL